MGRDTGGSDLGGMGGESKIAKLSRILRTTRVKVNELEKKQSETDKKVALNAEKITRIKNILKDNRKNVADQLKAQDNTAIFTEIAGKVQSIASALEGQQKFTRGQADKDRQQQQKRRASAREKLLEGGKGALGAVKSTAEKIASPLRSMFDELFNFLINVVLGRAIFKMFEWFQDEENQKKINTIFRFIKDWWPTLLAGLILFGGALLGPVGLIIGITALALGFIPRLVDATKKIFGFGDDVEKGVQKATEVTKDSESRIGGVNDPDQQQDIDLSQQKVMTQMEKLREPDEGKPQERVEFAKGGMVRGPGGIDNVPAMLTAGEYVISKGAVDKFGSGMFAALNAAGGGKGEPSGGNYSTGGMVFNLNPQRTFNHTSRGSKKTISNSVVKHYNSGGLVKPSRARHFYFKFAGGGEVPQVDPVESTRVHNEAFAPPPDYPMEKKFEPIGKSFGTPKLPSGSAIDMAKKTENPFTNFVNTVKNYFIVSSDDGTSMRMGSDQNYKAPRVDPPMGGKSKVVIAPMPGQTNDADAPSPVGSRPPSFSAATHGSRAKTQTLGVVV